MVGWWGGVLVFVFALVVDTVFVRSLQSFHLVFLCPIPLLIPCCLYLSDPFNHSICSLLLLLTAQVSKKLYNANKFNNHVVDIVRNYLYTAMAFTGRPCVWIPHK